MDTHSISDEFCETHHTIPIKMSTKKILSMFNGWYDNKDGVITSINTKDKSLIGKTLDVYSPMTCACEDEVCKICYGDLSKFNKNMNIGIIAVLLLTEPLTQRLKYKQVL